VSHSLHDCPLVYFVERGLARVPRNWREVACGAMVCVWSVSVLFLIAQLFEFRDVTGNLYLSDDRIESALNNLVVD
jgi:hypothetical protein